MTISDSIVLHDTATYLQPGEWWACHQPERPYDPVGTWMEDRCRACVLSLGAAAAAHPDCRITDFPSGKTMTLAEAYEDLRHQHGLPPLPAEPDR